MYFIFSWEYNCNAVLVSTVQQSESAVYTHASPPSWTSLHPTPILLLWVITEHQSELPVLCRNFPLAIYLTHGSECTTISQFVPHLLLPSLCPHIHSLCLRLYSCPGNRFICAIFLDVDRSRVCHIEWSKSGREKQILHINTCILK